MWKMGNKRANSAGGLRWLNHFNSFVVGVSNTLNSPDIKFNNFYPNTS